MYRDWYGMEKIMIEVRVVLDKGVYRIYNVDNKILNRKEKELVKYALDVYGFVNKKFNDYYFDVTVREWIENIKNVYSLTPRTKEVINVLSKIG